MTIKINLDLVETIDLIEELKKRNASGKSIREYELEKYKIDRSIQKSKELLDKHKEIAKMIIVDGVNINEAARKIGISFPAMRQRLHAFCKASNPELWHKGYHFNRYADGTTNWCPPSLEFIRKNASGFIDSP